MEFDFYYADLQLGVTFNAAKGDAFAGLTDNERLTLQQIVYLALNTFLLTRALSAADAVEFAKRIERTKSQPRMTLPGA